MGRLRIGLLIALVAAVVAACAASPASPSVVARTPAGSSTGSAVAASPAPTPSSPSSPPASAKPVQSPTQEAPVPDFALTSTAFEPGGAVPRRYTCDGEDVSPDLSWSGAPDGTKALALVVDDPDARGWVHWIVLDMAGTVTGGLPRGVGTSPDAPAQGRNDFGRIGWGGPCPPSGTHRYTFTLYALAAPLALPGQPDGDAVRKAIGRAEVLDKAVLEGTYRRGG